MAFGAANISVRVREGFAAQSGFIRACAAHHHALLATNEIMAAKAQISAKTTSADDRSIENLPNQTVPTSTALAEIDATETL
jgi:hypothetical protein